MNKMYCGILVLIIVKKIIFRSLLSVICEVNLRELFKPIKMLKYEHVRICM